MRTVRDIKDKEIIKRDAYLHVKSFDDAADLLGIEDRDKFYKLIRSYAYYPVEPDLKGYNPLIIMAFTCSRVTIDNCYKKWLTKVENGRKGGLAKAAKLAKSSESSKSKRTVAAVAGPTDTDYDYDYVNDYVNDSVKDLNKKKITKKKSPASPAFKLKDCITLYLPDGFNRDIWVDWCNYKASIKNLYQTERGAKAAITAIYNLSAKTGDAIETLVNHAIDNEWLGVHEIKQFNKNNNDDNQDTFEDDSQYK